MADRFYGCEFGAMNDADITEGGASTAARDVEIRITYDATGNSKLAALNAIELLKRRIIQEPWPLA